MRLTGWQEEIFGRCYQAIVVSHEEEAHRATAISARPRREGGPCRTAPGLARGARFQYATREVLELDPLPCWEHLTAEQRRARIAALVEDIESEAAIRRKKTGAKPLGVAAVLAQNPLQRPKKTKKSPAPAFHAASQAVRRELRDAYAMLVAAYRDAAEKLRAGVRNVVFPAGSFPPPLPFVDG